MSKKYINLLIFMIISLLINSLTLPAVHIVPKRIDDLMEYIDTNTVGNIKKDINIFQQENSNENSNELEVEDTIHIYDQYANTNESENDDILDGSDESDTTERSIESTAQNTIPPKIRGSVKRILWDKHKKGNGSKSPQKSVMLTSQIQGKKGNDSKSILESGIQTSEIRDKKENDSKSILESGVQTSEIQDNKGNDSNNIQESEMKISEVQGNKGNDSKSIQEFVILTSEIQDNRNDSKSILESGIKISDIQGNKGNDSKSILESGIQTSEIQDNKRNDSKNFQESVIQTSDLQDKKGNDSKSIPESGIQTSEIQDNKRNDSKNFQESVIQTSDLQDKKGNDSKSIPESVILTSEIQGNIGNVSKSIQESGIPTSEIQDNKGNDTKSIRASRKRRSVVQDTAETPGKNKTPFNNRGQIKSDKAYLSNISEEYLSDSSINPVSVKIDEKLIGAKEEINKINYNNSVYIKKSQHTVVKRDVWLEHDSFENSAPISTIEGDKLVGSKRDKNLHPYLVSYGKNCVGSIIDKLWVLTAAHCGDSTDFVNTRSAYLYKGTKIFIKEHHYHPKWLSPNTIHPYDYDYLLLKLYLPLSFNINVQPIKFANKAKDVAVKNASVAILHKGVLLLQSKVILKKNEDCQNVKDVYSVYNLTRRMFCAGRNVSSSAPASKIGYNMKYCQGDGGGPVVQSGNILLGMVSYSMGCAGRGVNAIFSNVTLIKPWIKNITHLKFD